MTYRELLELYKTGELELEQRKKVEKDIERQEAISDYLYEQEDIPELNDIFEEKAAAEKNNKRNDDIGDIDTKFIEMVNRSIRRAFRKMGLTILAAAFVLILFVQFCLPTIVSCFYYNPAKNIGDKDYAISKMSRDMAVYSEVFLPGKRRGSVQVEAKGYGNYNITVNQTSSFTGSLTDVSGEITRGELRYYDNNIFKKPATNVFVYGSIAGKEENTVEENLKYTKLDTNAQVMATDVLSALARLRGTSAFGIIFMDPPYNHNLEKQVLASLNDSNLVDEDTLLIVEASKETTFDDVEALGYSIIKEKLYKTNKHVFLEKTGGTVC